MAHEMRRWKQALAPEVCEEILDRGTAGVLSLAGEDGWPYAVPLSYVRGRDKLYFHCAVAGYKLDCIRRDSRASFCVVDQDEIVPEEYTTYYRSVLVSGRVRILEDAAEKRAAIELLGRKYAPEESAEHLREEIDRSWERLCLLELAVERMTGKESRELSARRERRT